MHKGKNKNPGEEFKEANIWNRGIYWRETEKGDNSFRPRLTHFVGQESPSKDVPYIVIKTKTDSIDKDF